MHLLSASYAACAVASGRRLCGQLKAKDALNEFTQRQQHFTVCKLPDFSTLSDNPLAEALQDNTRTPPPDAAAFRIDWPAWLRTRTQRDRRIIHDMAMSERTDLLARKFGISPGRVSQLRREYCEDWNRFCGEAPQSSSRRVSHSVKVIPFHPGEPMSHLVKIQTQLRDPIALAATCRRLNLAAPIHGTAKLYSSEATGLLVQLPGWKYPLVIDPASGDVQYDNFQGHWGERRHLDRFLQIYAAEKAAVGSRLAAISVMEQSLADGWIKVSVLAS